MATSEVYRTAITGAEVRFSEWVRSDRTSGLGFMIDHPAGPTTNYSIEATDSTEQDIANNVQRIIAYTPPTIPTKGPGAEVFGVELTQFQHQAARVRLANVSGTGTPVIRARHGED